MTLGRLLIAVLLLAMAPSLSLGQGTLRGPAQPDRTQAGAPAADGTEAKDADPNAPPAPVRSPSPYAMPNVAAPPTATVPLLTAQDQARAQCSARCARDYYFCMAGEYPEFCPSSWGDCNTACGIAARRGS